MGLIKDILNIKSLKSEHLSFKTENENLKAENRELEQKLLDTATENESFKAKIQELDKKLSDLEVKNKNLKLMLSESDALNENLKIKIIKLEKKLSDLDGETYFSVKEKINELNNEYVTINTKIKDERLKFVQEQNRNQEIIDSLTASINELKNQQSKTNQQFEIQKNKLRRIKSLYLSIKKSIENYHSLDVLIPVNEYEFNNLIPTVELKLHCMDIKSLRKEYRENQKLIDSVLNSYSNRYTTKSNKSIYSLMVIALKSELQNIIYNLKYQRLDSAIDDVKKVTQKYLDIANSGNQTIAGTLHKFIDEIEYLFINAVKIEYNYYVKKEQARQEQLAIRQQIREEAREKRALLQQQKKVEKEEEKYIQELNKVESLLTSSTDNKEVEQLKARILELQSQLSDVLVKKEEIINLQNGKAGNVYIISNIGSFGNGVFKIGMTRRLDPQERVDELGSASVPFKFDVHSFIFSENAPELEAKIHKRLNDKRVNKVNMRKEFFRISIDELEQLVDEIEPTAEFNKTILATEFRQSLSSDENYTSDYILEDE